MIQYIKQAVNLQSKITWVALGAALVAVGFLVDGITEVGHHAFLILGGITVGAGARSSK